MVSFKVRDYVVPELTEAPSFPGINEFVYMYTSFQPEENPRGLFHSTVINIQIYL